jgi:hypothetical protein
VDRHGLLNRRTSSRRHSFTGRCSLRGSAAPRRPGWRPCNSSTTEWGVPPYCGADASMDGAEVASKADADVGEELRLDHCRNVLPIVDDDAQWE